MLLFNDLSPVRLITVLITLLVAMTVHEFAHNYVAHIMGDPTPKRLGRLTLNPLVHINWIGFLMFALIGFGILGSAPISPYAMPINNRRWRWFAAVAAGPVSNLLLAMAAALLFQLVPIGRFGASALDVFNIYYTFIIFNLVLFLFNLLPLFPIDGWQMVYALLPPDLALWWERNRSNSQFVFFVLLLLSFVPSLPNPLTYLVFEPANSLAVALLSL